jgi:hypothetical protein
MLVRTVFDSSVNHKKETFHYMNMSLIAVYGFIRLASHYPSTQRRCEEEHTINSCRERATRRLQQNVLQVLCIFAQNPITC